MRQRRLQPGYGLICQRTAAPTVIIFPVEAVNSVAGARRLAGVILAVVPTVAAVAQTVVAGAAAIKVSGASRTRWGRNLPVGCGLQPKRAWVRSGRTEAVGEKPTPHLVVWEGSEWLSNAAVNRLPFGACGFDSHPSHHFLGPSGPR